VTLDLAVWSLNKFCNIFVLDQIKQMIPCSFTSSLCRDCCFLKKNMKCKLIRRSAWKSWRKFHRWKFGFFTYFHGFGIFLSGFVCFSSLLLILTKWLRMNRQYRSKAYLTPAKLLKDPLRGFGATAFPATTNNEQARVLCSCKRIPRWAYCEATMCF